MFVGVLLYAGFTHARNPMYPSRLQQRQGAQCFADAAVLLYCVLRSPPPRPSARVVTVSRAFRGLYATAARLTAEVPPTHYRFVKAKPYVQAVRWSLFFQYPRFRADRCCRHSGSSSRCVVPCDFVVAVQGTSLNRGWETRPTIAESLYTETLGTLHVGPFVFVKQYGVPLARQHGR